MTQEEIEKIIQKIEKDIKYFSALEFNQLASKFQRDLDLVQYLRNNSPVEIQI